MTEYFISYYVEGCPYVGDGEYEEGKLLGNELYPSSIPKYRGWKACDFCSSFKTCPKKKKTEKNLYSRCSIGDLSEEEVGYFKQQFGFEEDRHVRFGHELVLQSKSQIPFGSLDERLTHQRLLKLPIY
jgi:hypothetical protein